MTAGSGLVHAELSPEGFLRDGGRLEILQLWVNLPARLKMTRPRYQGVQRPQIPALVSDRGRSTVSLIAGAWGGQTGPIASLTGVFMTTIELQPGGRVGFGSLAGRNVFLYLVRGAASVNGMAVADARLVELDLDGDTVEILAEADSLLVFGHAEPIGEPVVAHGPFVMNTRQEIVQAISDYQAGLFDGVRL